ncbi:D-aspartate oxidase-like isoform X1 [Patiria miniata]|uniref:FAD dependent oxidoreductase domain-containing protein n=1 Tax=Patiria miniata TaxID=46514 RepID=A0A913ZZK6_PATMI|nr:D-aspartate oxidase-like isoform X1 [Patiria miniata]XP_038056764.1 D-aspartate oxidase-like isoform X1 [Patiria miniata]XP_038056765.1 D-aspartate oxidase-like isoform X1 [Patiria miniata]
MVYRVGVVGAGVIGLSTAYNIKDRIPDAEVTIVADRFSPNTTGDGTGGLWMPYMLGSTPTESVMKWGKRTWDHLIKILRSPEADAAGVSIHSGHILYEQKPEQDPFWKDMVFHFKHFTQRELDILFPGVKFGVHATMMFCLCLRYLPWLMQRYKAIGGRVMKQRLSSLDEIADLYDVIVACPGVRARHLLDDKEVYPIRGQIVTFTNPRSAMSYLETTKPDDSSDTYFLPSPSAEYIHCGGTAQVNNWNEESDPEDVKGIIERCTKLVPSLKSAKVVSTWAGLRPGRSSIRLEKEDKMIGGKLKKVVYNYGHGGSGITLHWGCSLEATELVRQSIAELQAIGPTSKL